MPTFKNNFTIITCFGVKIELFANMDNESQFKTLLNDNNQMRSVILDKVNHMTKDELIDLIMDGVEYDNNYDEQMIIKELPIIR